MPVWNKDKVHPSTLFLPLQALKKKYEFNAVTMGREQAYVINTHNKTVWQISVNSQNALLEAEAKSPVSHVAAF